MRLCPKNYNIDVTLVPEYFRAVSFPSNEVDCQYWLVGWMEQTIDRWMNRRMDRYIVREMDGSMDGWIDGSMDQGYNRETLSEEL